MVAAVRSITVGTLIGRPLASEATSTVVCREADRVSVLALWAVPMRIDFHLMAFVYGGWLRRSCGNLDGRKCILGKVVLPVHRARLGGYI
jgi:hypothetical protein